MLKVIGGVAVVAIVLFGLPWLFTGNAVAIFRVFAPQTEQIRRETFEQSKAYRQGLIQELQNMQFQYEQARPEHKAALRSLILKRVADMPEDMLTSNLHEFISQLRRVQ